MLVRQTEAAVKRSAVVRYGTASITQQVAIARVQKLLDMELCWYVASLAWAVRSKLGNDQRHPVQLVVSKTKIL